MKIFIGNVIWRNEEVHHSRAMRELYYLLAKRDIQFQEGSIYNDALVSRTRSQVASMFLRSKADVLITLDSDVGFDPEDVISICEKAEDFDLIGGMYAKREEPSSPASLIPLDTPIIFDNDQPPVRVPFVTTGFMAVHRRVFELLSQSLPLCHPGWVDYENQSDLSFWPFYAPYWLEYEGKTIYLSEDWALCDRVKKAGFGVWLDPTIRLIHVGPKQFLLEDMIRECRIPPTPLEITRTKQGITIKRPK